MPSRRSACRLSCPPDAVARCVAEAGIGFTFAPRFHHGLRHAVPVRKALGIPTAINYLAPLTNPANPGATLVGCSNLALAPVLTAVLADRGTRALVVRGNDGLGEITTAAPTSVWTAGPDGVTARTLDTARYGLPRATADGLRGGDAVYNATVVHRVLGGERGAARDAVLANAAGALLAQRGTGPSQLDDAFADALDTARTAVDDGTAAATLDRWLKLAISL